MIRLGSRFEKLGLAVTFWESNLKLYEFPSDLIFGPSLHFIAALRVPNKGNTLQFPP